MNIDPALLERVLDLAVEIQQIPAPTFSEKRRAKFIEERFAEEDLADVSVDPLGNVFARLPGKGEKPPLIVSAHSDTVFPARTNLSVRREADQIFGPGIGDNSLGVAGLFGLRWLLQQHHVNLAGDVWLVANVGEEGLGNLGGMKAVVNRFGQEVLAYLILEGMALGQIYHQALEVERYKITVKTNGGHSWVDYGRPSAIHVLAAFVSRLAALQLPSTPRTTLNVGVISGGTSVNTIASEASIELDLRSEDRDVLQGVVEQVQALIDEAGSPEVEVGSTLIGRRPSGRIPRSHPLVQLAVRSLESQGIQARFNAGSTDANVPLNRGLPAVCLGLSTGCGAHTTEEYIHTQPLAKGLAQLLLVVEGAFQKL